MHSVSSQLNHSSEVSSEGGAQEEERFSSLTIDSFDTRQLDGIKMAHQWHCSFQKAPNQYRSQNRKSDTE